MASDTQQALTERKKIDAEIEGKTFCDILARNAEQYATAPALSWREPGQHDWTTITWGEYRDRVAEVTLGLKALGVGKGDFVAIMARNRPEHVLADWGIMHAGGTPVSIYNTLAPEQIAYIAGHCEARMAVVEDRGFMERWEKVKADLPNLERVIMINDAEEFADYDWVTSWNEVVAKGKAPLAAAGGREEFERTRRQVNPDDIITLIYTSGTTGPPKGVITTQRNELWTCDSLDKTGQWPMGMLYVSYLPLAHSLERSATIYMAAWKATRVYFCPDVLQVFEYVPEVRPLAFVGPPRVWEKLEAGIMAALAAEPNERRRRIALGAIETAKRAVALEREGKKVPAGLKAKRRLFDRLVFSKIRQKIGLDRSEVNISGAAPIASSTVEFFYAIGLPVVEGWGMTESCSGGTIIRGEAPGKIGTVGPALPGVEVKLSEDGEILVRGGNVCPGYYKEPQQSAETFDAEGWLHTGDVGQWDPDGYLKIVDRKKELIITAGGKNISPSNLESLLKRNPLISQACAARRGSGMRTARPAPAVASPGARWTNGPPPAHPR